MAKYKGFGQIFYNYLYEGKMAGSGKTSSLTMRLKDKLCRYPRKNMTDYEISA